LQTRSYTSQRPQAWLQHQRRHFFREVGGRGTTGKIGGQENVFLVKAPGKILNIYSYEIYTFIMRYSEEKMSRKNRKNRRNRRNRKNNKNKTKKNRMNRMNRMTRINRTSSMRRMNRINRIKEEQDEQDEGRTG
jgi:hypothetical protein